MEVSKRNEEGIFLGGIRLCISGKMTEEKLEEGDNSRMRISGNERELGGNEKRYRMERKLLSVLLVCGLGG